MPKIPLSQGKVALVDDEDFEFLMQWNWCDSGCGYAMRTARKRELELGMIKGVYMHRVVLERMLGRRILDSEECDHINKIRSDNRRENLRVCNRSQNMMNKDVMKDSSTGCKGVYKHKRWPTKPFQARICVNGIRRSLGAFATKEEAAKAYDDAARELGSEFVRIL